MVTRGFVLKCLVSLLVITALFFAVRHKRDFWDFEVYRTAGIRALAAEPLYRADDGHYQFKYWPAFALVMAPMGFLPDELAKLVWFGLSFVLLGFYLRRSLTQLPAARSSRRWLIAWTLLLTAKFIVKELVNGQTNILLGILVLLAAIALDTNRPRLAGVLVALAVFVKPYALLLVPWVLVTGGAGAGLALAGGLGAGLMLPAALYGWAGNLSLLSAWYATVTETTAPNLLIADNISLASMWAKWLGAGSRASMLALITAGACLALAGLVWSYRTRVERPAFLEASLLLLLMPLISPQGWDYVLLLALPGFVCLVDRFRERAWLWQVVTIVGFFLTSFTVFDLLGRSLYLRLMSLSAVSVGAILLVISLAHLRLRRLA